MSHRIGELADPLVGPVLSEMKVATAVPPLVDISREAGDDGEWNTAADGTLEDLTRLRIGPGELRMSVRW
jgi:hypothetical protein